MQEPSDYRSNPVNMIPSPFTFEQLEAAFSDLVLEATPLGEGAVKVAYKAFPNPVETHHTLGSDPGRIGDHSIPSISVLKVVKQPYPSWTAEATSDPASDEDAADAELDKDQADLLERLRREVAAMQEINCPNVVSIVGGPGVRHVGKNHHLWYLEPFYAGGTLKSRLDLSALTPDEVARLAADLLSAIAAIGRAGRVHRDIKPANVLFDEEQNAVVIDLGFALHLELPDVTESSTTHPGTTQYAAPEQFKLKRDAIVDGRTDMFSAGVVLFEALTGKKPFGPCTHPSYMDRILSYQFDRAGLESVRDVSDGLKSFICRLIRPQLSQRYRTVQAAQRALEAA